ncbi:hypothetical protein ALR00_03461, partial [Pseudomonas savastanoi pv. retacarpa]
ADESAPTKCIPGWSSWPMHTSESGALERELQESRSSSSIENALPNPLALTKPKK